MDKKIKVLFINSVCGYGSTGNIVEDLANIDEIDGLILYGRNSTNSSKAYKITNLLENAIAAFNTIFFNKNGLSNKKATFRAIKKIEEFNPDIIHLHILHGYYINYKILFEFLRKYNKPVIWTLHECWALTGYCTIFEYAKCDKYKTECNDCPHMFSYPFSIFKQGIKDQYYLKKQLFNDVSDLTLVTPSVWLKDRTKESFLKEKNAVVIFNGVDTNIFRPSVPKNEKFTIIFVANVWTKEKGLDEISRLLPLLDDDIKVIIVGKIKPTRVIKKRCIITGRIYDKQKLRDLYSQSHVFVNPTFEDVFGMVNAEAMACGTYVITYDAGGSSEIVGKYGTIVKSGDVKALASEINKCRAKHIQLYNYNNNIYSKETMLNNYLNLYKEILEHK